MNPVTLVSACMLVFLSLIAPVESPGRATQTNAQGTVAVTISAKPSTLTLHEPVLLTFQIANKGNDTARIDLGRDRKENFLIAITPPDGHKTELPQLRRSGFNRLGEVEIGAGDSYSQSLILNEWYDFKDVGSYEIEVRLVKPVLVRGEPTGGQGDFHASLEIKPRSEQVLKTRCEAIVAGVESSTSYEDAAQDALALSYVKDSVAVPYLEKVLEANKLVEPIAIKGLERIATPEAVRVLSSALKMTQNSASVLARSALLRIESQTSDPHVKQEILRVISDSPNPGS